LAQNCCADAVRVLTELRAKHAPSDGSGMMLGINGNTGKIKDM
jgi:chaperonin GroEL (HSP60 family)